MADKVLTKLNTDFYITSELSGTSLYGTYGSEMVRWNSAGTSAWIYGAFTTDNYNVSNITIKVIDCNVRENKQGYPCIGIASYVQHHPGGAVSPVCLAKARDAENNPSHGDGTHNCYDVTLSVNLKARTTYYLYLFIEGDSTSSSLAWLPLTYPLASVTDRTTLVELHYNSYEYSAPPTNYTVTLNKGTGISAVTGGGTYQSGTSVSISATPSSGYEFNGWTGYNSSSSNPYTFTLGQNRTYTANARVKTYTVTYNKGSYGSGTNTTATKTHGQTLTLADSLFTRDGYTQNGWASDAAGTTKAYNLKGSYTNNADVTLYPYWGVNTYTITYRPGVHGTGNQVTQSKNHGTSVTLQTNIYTRQGYTQSGWAIVENGSKTYDANGTYSTNADIILYPAWVPDKYTVSYNKGTGGSGTNTSAQKSHDITLTLKGAIFTRTGYTQIGWSISDNGSKNYELSGSYTDNASVTLYPAWSANGLNIAYKKDSYSTGTEVTDSKPYDGTVTLRGAIFTRDGYKQIGWATSSGGAKAYDLNASYSGNSALTLYPVWSGISYEIQYNGNGATGGTMNNSTHVYGTAKTLTANTFTRTGYSFASWNTKADGSGTSYTDKKSVSNLTKTDGDVINLYAQWSNSVYTVKFDFNGGTYVSGNFTAMSCNRDTAYTIPTGTLTYDNRVLLGWSTTKTATTATYGVNGSFNNLGTIGSTVTLYAIWKAKSITVTYHINNGGTDTTVSSTYTATSTSNAFRTLPSGWTKSGYTASGWSRSSSAQVPEYRLGEGFLGDLGLANNGTLHLYMTWIKQQAWSYCVIKLYTDTNGSFIYV